MAVESASDKRMSAASASMPKAQKQLCAEMTHYFAKMSSIYRTYVHDEPTMTSKMNEASNQFRKVIAQRIDHTLFEDWISALVFEYGCIAYSKGEGLVEAMRTRDNTRREMAVRAGCYHIDTISGY